jgi:hypothetical protein
MATRSASPDRAPRAAQPPAFARHERGVGKRWRSRRAERRHARLISLRNRRKLAKWLRRTAKDSVHFDPRCRRYDLWLRDRAAAVRRDLLEIAAMLEWAQHPDPACVAAVRELLTDGVTSPLINPALEVSELDATLDHIRCGLRRALPTSATSGVMP